MSQEIYFEGCEFRKFLPDEKHITRKWNKSVFLLIFKNTLNFEEDGKEISVSENTWYIQRDNLLQRGNIGSPAPEYFYVHFDGKYLDNAEYAGAVLPITGKFNAQTIYPLVKELYENQSDMKNGILYGKIIFQYILLKIKEEFQATQNGTAFQIRQYLLGNFDKAFFLEDLASQFGYCNDYLGKTFKRQFEISIYEYVVCLRIQKAKQLLLTSTKSISQISEEVGYTSPSLLYKAFVKREKVSPQCWKYQHRGDVPEAIASFHGIREKN